MTYENDNVKIPTKYIKMSKIELEAAKKAKYESLKRVKRVNDDLSRSLIKF